MYNIRNATPDDYAFVRSTLRSAKLHGADRDDVFNILIKCCDAYILTPEGTDDLIIATCLSCDDKLVWIYVKEIYRHGGIAEYLLDSCGVHQEFYLKGTTDAWKSLAKKRQLKWNPYLILPTLNYINL